MILKLPPKNLIIDRTLIGVESQTRTEKLVISSCHLNTTNESENTPEAISEGIKLEGIMGEHARDPLEGALSHAFPPPLISTSIILP